MTREEAKGSLIAIKNKYLANYGEDSIINILIDEYDIQAIDVAIQALEQEPCEDAISRQAVEDKLLKLCNQLEGIFANIRMQNQDESVCGLCEYDCPAPYECPGFDTEDCFKLAYEKRYEWQSTEDLHSVKSQTGHWIMQHRKVNTINYRTGEDVLTGEIHTVKELIRYECDEPYCSECGKRAGDTSGNYCCFCGARMESEQNG